MLMIFWTFCHNYLNGCDNVNDKRSPPSGRALSYNSPPQQVAQSSDICRWSWIWWKTRWCWWWCSHPPWGHSTLLVLTPSPQVAEHGPQPPMLQESDPSWCWRSWWSWWQWTMKTHLCGFLYDQARQLVMTIFTSTNLLLSWRCWSSWSYWHHMYDDVDHHHHHDIIGMIMMSITIRPHPI